MVEISSTKEKSNIINQLFEEEKWEEAREYILKCLVEEPESHWLLSRLSVTYYEQKNYEKALKYIKKALKIAPHCPLVLWDYAGTLDMLSNNEEALRIFKSIIRKGVSRIARGECSEGIRWARSLVNDSRYRVGLLYARLGDFRLAKKYVNAYIKNRKPNTPSIYSISEAKKKLVRILEGRDPRLVTP
jgi:tetratricopeptide (TPR) repeat protein